VPLGGIICCADFARAIPDLKVLTTGIIKKEQWGGISSDHFSAKAARIDEENQQISGILLSLSSL